MQNKSFTKNILHGIQMRLGKIFHNPYRSVNIGPFKKIYYKHLTSGPVRTHRLFGKELYYTSPAELLHGLEEIFIEKVYQQQLPPKPFIIDCGANIGLSLIYLKQLSPDAEIIAFEPDERNFELLTQNVRSFGLSQVDLRREAVWVEDTNLQFVAEGSMSSRIKIESSGQTAYVKAIRLKKILNRCVDFLKIDIEGAEFSVMMDIADELHFVNHLFLEYHGSFEQNKELSQLFALLVQNGFSYYIKEATSVYDTPFEHLRKTNFPFDVQLNIFCFRN